METQVEKMLECEFAQVDKTSAPCHNPPTFIDRKGGHVVCIAHADGLEVFLAQQAAQYKADNEVVDNAVAASRQHAQNEEFIRTVMDIRKTGGIPMFTRPGGIIPGVSSK